MIAKVCLVSILNFMLVGRLVKAQSCLPIPITFPVISGDERSCPPDEQLEQARAELMDRILTVINDTFAPGAFHNPVPSCADLPQDYPSGIFWIQASDMSSVTQQYCNTTCCNRA